MTHFLQHAKAWRHWCLAFIILLSAPLQAQEKLTMNMRDADIRALIQWVADNTGKNIIVHKAVQGKVTVLSSHPVSPEEAYQVFLSVLQVHGYAAIETNGTLKIVPGSLANQSGIPFSTGTDSGDMIVNVIRVENISAQQLAMMLRPLLSKDAVVTPHAETNVIVVADHAQNLSNLRPLIAQLDQAGDTAIELVRLKHANAEDILQSLQALLPNTGPEGAALGLNLGMDERTNSILLSGDPAKRKQFKQLIRQLDAPLSGDGNTQVYYLNYVDAEELVPILQSISQSIETEQKKKESAVSIESSVSANALVINAPPAMQSSFRRVIEQLDIRRAQVLIESVVVEVSGDVAEDIGVSWLAVDDINEANDAAGFGAVNTLGDLQLGEVVRADVPEGEVGPGPVTGVVPAQGFTFGYFEKGNLQAALRLLEQNTKTNVLSTPTIVAIDNEEASLLVGQNVPFKTGEATSGASDTTNPFTTIERQDIGINLTVTPRINQGDSITLDIKQSVESIEPSLDIASDIITNKREIITKALIKDDQILVLGGLIDEREIERKEKVPVLGDIPVLGALFRSTSKDHNKENLMVFIHPVILKDDEHIRSVTQRRYNFMRETQERSKEDMTIFNRADPPTLEKFDTFTPVNRQPAVGEE